MEILTLPVYQCYSLKHPAFEGLLRPPFVSPRRTDGPAKYLGYIRYSGNVFANPQASSSAPYPQELNPPWKKTIEEPLHMSAAEKSDRPERNQNLRCQSGPSAKDSVIFSGGDFSKNYGADQQRLQISDLHFNKFPTPATFACWKIRFKTEVCTCSQFPVEAMQWMERRWGPQGRSITGGGGLARVPNLRVCKHPTQEGWHMQGWKDELTFCRGTV